jgi:hypothetical protein
VSAGLTLPLTALTAEQFRSLLPEWAAADQSAIMLGLEKLNKLKIDSQ